MGRKKPTARDDEIQDGGGKSRKKAVVVDDDEYSIGTELSEEQQVQDEKIAPVGGKKKGKNGASKNSQQKDEDVEKEDEDDDDAPAVQFAGKKKSRSKKSGSSTSFSSSSFGLLGEVDDDDDDESAVTRDNDDGVDSDDDDEPVVSFSGKNKSSKSGKGNSNRVRASAFGAIADDDEEGGDAIDNSVTEKQSDFDDDVVISFSGKKKHSKSNKKSSASVSAGSGIDELDCGGETKDEVKEEEEEDDGDVAAISFSGKKKWSSSSSKKSSEIYSDALIDEETEEGTSFTNDDSANLDEHTSEVMFYGKKKSSKKKSNSVFSALESRLGDESNVDPGEPSVVVYGKEADDSKTNKRVIEDVVETSKNKKKKKKSGRTAQEEDDLDKLLGEPGEGSTVAKPAPAPPPPPPQENKVQTQLESLGLVDASLEKEAEEEGGVESAAAKKKKKKKEKEREKKAAAAAAAATTPAEELRQEKQEDANNETKGKATDKKVPKHVREMQERLARLKELEEKKKREEEEKLRKEEEERRRQEELERLAEEKKRLRKEKEKEKLQKKKLEGKLLTGKQKEEVRRLEAMRNQILVNAGGLPVAAGAPTKRPKYQTKKKTHNSQANGVASEKASESTEAMEDQQESVAEVESLEIEGVQEVETVNVEEKAEVVTDVVEENVIEEDDDEDEWDAKSWDEADLNLPGTSAFADEEDESEPEHVGKKEASTSKAAVVAPKVTTTLPVKSLDGDSKKSRPEADSVDTNKGKEPKCKKEPQTPDAQRNQSEADLRSPICCIMGHVDTGKTKLLDCIRGTNVQEGEAGGITQQIGATYFPAVNIRERTKELKADAKLKVPGLLVIDTPGHESFTNLRSRGSGLCDIAILVVDIMHGLEPQTIESLNLLKMRNTEFIVALNKVDRLYGWKSCRNAPIVKTMKQQSKDVQLEFNMRVTQVITQFKEQGLNTELYYKNKEMGETFSIVPTSAISGEGIPDLLLLLVQWTQKTMVEKLTFSNEVQCTVLEVKVIEGHGTTIDVVLVNGVLHEGDQIVVCGMQVPIVTTIRALLTPHPMKELRVKGTYLHHKEIKAAQGIKINAQGLEHAIAGTGLYVVGPNDDLEDIKESAMEDMKSVLSRIDKSGEGVCVQASTLGSLEALLEFLKSPAVKIPVSCISIGPVHKKDVMKASVMLEKKKEFATILAFDVKVTPEARELADEAGVKIFIADIIYHLFDQFKAYIDNLKEEKKKEASEEAVFPCVLRIMPNCVFNNKDPIVLGVDVVEGIAKVGTPICIPQREFIDIGRIASIENNHKPVDYAKKGQKVAIKIVGSNSEEQQRMFGRHFEMEDELVSHISRKSIDVLKTNYRDDLSIEEWRLLAKLKNLFKIQ
ncbi:eukaryotic translation initiation factor 5B-like [Rhododendron vialii]|uniref:eukaryotic translation initiation factor 5B-like n=1 Tax=Rhododendron vialii TaxID=182163 RepID=UPI00265F854D|nr:eukaryotic translation initiation factor 5B-like [Rhododendron vialii]XP_058204346.1 eukaryotic translation initiation factor 5B-like [Rhododendron vialii]XP_058204347.1 eukaryotic translation initiation factor 5B-like [Rhododendron vialii]